MVREALAASALLVVSASAVFAQGETTTTQPAIVQENSDDASRRLPTAGTADVGNVVNNADGSRGATRSTTDFNNDSPEITDNNNDDADARIRSN